MKMLISCECVTARMMVSLGNQQRMSQISLMLFSRVRASTVVCLGD